MNGNKLSEWKDWREQVAQACHGNWESVFGTFCNDPRIDTLLRGRNVTCPECGKKDKLFVANKGTFAAHCCSKSCDKHYFDGIALLAELNGESQTDVLKKLSAHLGIDNQSKATFAPTKKAQPNNTVVPFKKEVVEASKPKKVRVKEREFLAKAIQPMNDTIEEYLANRGLNTDKLSQAVRSRIGFVDQLRYFKEILDDNDVIVDTEKGEFEGMVCKVYNARFDVVGYHKTYLQDGKKAPVSAAKQLTRAEFEGQYSELGAFIPFTNVTDGHYGIAEGLETTLALICMGRPCWSVLNANGVKTFQLPKDCHTLDIYGDLDRSGTGQKVMIEKFYELRKSHPHVKVNLFLPPIEMWDDEINPKGIDFLDVYKLDPSVFSPVGDK